MFGKLLEHKITMIVAVLACVGVLGVSGYYLAKPERKVLSSVQASSMNLQESVTADGSIDSDKHVSLSFQNEGTVTAVNVSVGQAVAAGQILASLDAGQLEASLSGARADVTSAQANLSTLQKGATPQTLSVYNQNVSTAKLALGSATHDAYLKVQDALLNKIGILFDNSTSANPTINIPTESYIIGTNLNSARLDMTTRLAKWNTVLTIDPASDSAVAETANDLAAAKSFMDTLSTEVNRLTANNSGISQAKLDANTAAMTAASTEVNTAQAEFNTALTTYRSANDQLSVITASSTPEAIQVALANLAKAQANVASIQSQISNVVLIAPWNGVIASVNPKVGEHFSANSPAIDIISSGLYKIDIMIPENEVGAISVGSPADIAFDTGGNVTATGSVSSIDLAPTITNGVGAYKATVYLGASDSRIRTGMTATVTIHGQSLENVLAIPESSIIRKSDGNYVLLLNNSGSYTEQKVTTGISGNGFVEITSGLTNGAHVATFGQ